MHKILAVLLWCSLSLPALAVQVTDLYTGQAQASGDVSAAQGEALGQVLLKLTGDKTVIAQPAVLQAMTTVSQLVRRYDYQTVDDKKMIRTEFEPAKVNDLLTEYGAKIVRDLSAFGSVLVPPRISVGTPPNAGCSKKLPACS